MIAPTSDCRPALREGAAILALPQHHPAGVGAAPPPAGRLLEEWQRDMRPAVVPVHKPTADECYGCVDWFPF